MILIRYCEGDLLAEILNAREKLEGDE